MRLAMACLFTCGALAACGGGDTALPSSNPDMTVVPFKLASGVYQIVSITDKVDGCNIDDPARPLLNATFTLIHPDVNGNVDLERFGNGKVSFNQGTLARSGRFDIGSCSFDFQTTVGVTVFADHQFRGNFVEKQSNRKSCLPNVGPSCQSAWKMELKKQ